MKQVAAKVDIIDCVYPDRYLVRPVVATVTMRFLQPVNRRTCADAAMEMFPGATVTGSACSIAPPGWVPPTSDWQCDDDVRSREWTASIEASDMSTAGRIVGSLR